MSCRATASRAHRALLPAALVCLLWSPSSATAALTDRAGAPIPQTDGTLEGHLTGAPGCRAGAAGPNCRLLAAPASPADDPPEALAALGGPGAPEDDLAAALSAMAAAPDAPAAARAVDEARAILAGDPLPGRAYSGIPLLNWNAPAKVRRVPAGGEVVVTVVRTPQQVLSDTWLLDFEDPAQPYTITYRVSEVGGALGGELRPTPLLGDAAGPLGGLHSAIVSLAPPPLALGTRLASRFTSDRGLPAAGAPESARAAVQTVSVRMPPARVTEAVLEPGRDAGDAAPLALAPATPARADGAAAALGFTGAAPTEAQRDSAISRLAPGAPERMLWDDLAALRGLAGDALLAGARSLGAQDASLVDAMRSRAGTPAGVSVMPTADVTVVLQNGESYVSRPRVRIAPGAPLRVQVVNRDGFERRVDVLALHDRRQVLGAEDWGAFSWTQLGRATLAAHRPPTADGGSELLTLHAPPATFALWLADPAGGDQAVARIDVETGPVRESVRLSPSDAALPVHAAFAPDGDLWVALAGVDMVARVTPAARLGDSRITRHLVPGGAHSPTSAAPPQAPTDVAADERGLVWLTLPAGNGLARVDPAAVTDGTEAGIRKYALPACGEGECAPLFAPAPGELPTRQPLQLEVSYDSDGTALLWFTESAANAIGLLRVAPDGRLLGQTQFSCGCTVPLGIALDADGDVWFTEGVDNRIGRLSPSRTDVASAADATLRHYRIPSAVPVLDPELSAVQVMTSTPHSVIVDGRGLVWFSEAATGKVGRLDPGQARPGTTDGIAEVALPLTVFGAEPTPADLTADRDGTVFWADEYGDAVGAIDTSGAPATWRARPPWRPAARRSLTDSPLLDEQGDLYFIESGATLLTRIGAVGAGQPRPAAPPRVELDLGADAVRVEGLREADALDVAIVRGDRTVASVGDVPVTGGGAAVAGAAWSAGPDALRPGDVVRLTPRGAHPRATLRMTAADLSAARGPAGITGRALVDGRPAAGAVEVLGSPGVRAPIDPVTGDYSVAAAALAGSPRAVAVSLATPGAVVRTVVALSGADVAPPAPVPPAATAPPGPPAPPAHHPGARTPRPAAVCARGLWLTATGGRPTPWLLGRSNGEVRACLGRPIAGGRAAPSRSLRYPGGLTLGLRAGRVEVVTVTAGGWTSARGGLRVGARRAAIRRALPAARRRGRAWHARLALDGKARAEVEVQTDRSGARVTRIVVRAIGPSA